MCKVEHVGNSATLTKPDILEQIQVLERMATLRDLAVREILGNLGHRQTVERVEALKPGMPEISIILELWTIMGVLIMIILNTLSTFALLEGLVIFIMWKPWEFANIGHPRSLGHLDINDGND